MEYNRGNYFCSSPHSDPTQYYDCKHTVDWEKYEGIEIRSTADCIPANEHPDWTGLLDEKMELVPPDPNFFNIAEYADRFSLSHEETIEVLSRRACYPVLKKNVVDWLNKHVAPSTDIQRVSMTNGWVVYSDAALIRNSTSSYTIFFLRRRDALNFIKVWSTLGKPTKIFKQ